MSNENLIERFDRWSAQPNTGSISQQVKREYEAIIDLGFTEAQARTIIVSRSIAIGNESKKKPQAEPHLHVSLSGDPWEG